ncbi:kelch motif family protein, putative [Ichthyophthirius multifiliis]|uniref:Kelch motif family protein, putative n=1 Tax=Ichthyophthirius multifiliis TaxID=5932 RepID=G0R4C5_ICHMU|nr:kelch motif family protein, putative [Ichthyophthirius multifiliis]EGR27675.1 kelch motif family protein, putative [Ichthyophthirius multifiliis]|eukprot:XP_004025127.1 kelch motif family protein, putative [Ichthyophthirius multifiliis]
MYLIGGWIDKGLYQSNVIYILDLDSLEWEKKPSIGQYPGPCNMHTAEVYENQIFVFRGGDGQQYLNDLHSLDIDTFKWIEVQTKNTKPQPRANHSSCLIKDEMYIFGGWDGFKRLNDLHKLNLRSLEWLKIDVKNDILPLPRAGMKILHIEDNIYMFGGSGNVNNGQNQLICYNDFWIFSIKDNYWNQCKIQIKGLNTNSQQSIQPRSGHSFNFFNDQIYVFGGSNGNNYFDSYIIFDVNPKPQLIANDNMDFDNFFLQNISSFYNQPQFSDIIILVQNQQFYAHKIILSSFSENLKMMFTVGMAETKVNQIQISDITPHVFSILLQGIYNRNLSLQKKIWKILIYFLMFIKLVISFWLKRLSFKFNNIQPKLLILIIIWIFQKKLNR